jgi:hypothetical protein
LVFIIPYFLLLLAGLQPSSERLVKAKSDGSLSSSAATTENSSALMSRLKSKSLEPLTGQPFNGPEAEFVAVLGIHDIFLQIRIRGSVPLTNESEFDSFLQYGNFQDAKNKKFYIYIFIITYPQAHFRQS